MPTSHTTLNCCTTHTATTEADGPTGAVDNCCAAPATRSTDSGGVLDEMRAEGTPADVAAIRSAGFRLLLDTGRPVTAADLIAATDVPSSRVAEILDSVRARGRVEFDDQGSLIGIAGLSLTPSRHELTIGDKTRWTWCALDALGILGALEATGHIRSTDPRTGAAVNIAFHDGHPDSDASLFILGGHDVGNVREDWCPQVNFFNTRSDAEAWVGNNDLDGDIVTVAQLAGDAAAMWKSVTDPNAPQVC